MRNCMTCVVSHKTTRPSNRRLRSRLRPDFSTREKHYARPKECKLNSILGLPAVDSVLLKLCTTPLHFCHLDEAPICSPISRSCGNAWRARCASPATSCFSDDAGIPSIDLKVSVYVCVKAFWLQLWGSAYSEMQFYFSLFPLLCLM